MKKVARILLFLFLLGIFFFSFWKLLGILNVYREGSKSYQQLEQYVSFEEPARPADETEEPLSAETEVTEEPFVMPDLSGWPQVDFEQLAQINSDVVGWIFIDGTHINYPVVQGQDNHYYMNRMFDGTVNKAGAIFLDADCEPDFSDKNSVLYGHHMKNNSMFADLVKYKKQAFYDGHPVALLLTPAAYYKIQFFSGYVSDNWSSAWDTAFTEENYALWLEEIQAKSRFTPLETPTVEDRVVTLSTCTYEFKNAKFVLHGYIVEELKVRP